MPIDGHSCPLWALGPKTDPFGNSYGGIPSVMERAAVICGLSQEVCSHTSFHLGHEVVAGVPWEVDHEDAMELDLLREMLHDSGKKVLAVTAPSFGLDGLSHGGAICSFFRDVRQRSHDLIVAGLTMTAELFEAGEGEGVYLWWPAMDSQRHPFSEQQRDEGRKYLLEFWAKMLSSPRWGIWKPEIWLEFKPMDPGDWDYWATWREAAEFCGALNEMLQYPAAHVNLEFAHASMIGADVREAVLGLFTAGVMKTIVHANSSNKPGADQDKRVGAVNNEETQAALKAFGNDEGSWIVEHDIKCTDGNPVQYYLDSVTAAQQMIAAE